MPRKLVVTAALAVFYSFASAGLITTDGDDNDWVYLQALGELADDLIGDVGNPILLTSSNAAKALERQPEADSTYTTYQEYFDLAKTGAFIEHSPGVLDHRLHVLARFNSKSAWWAHMMQPTPDGDTTAHVFDRERFAGQKGWQGLETDPHGRLLPDLFGKFAPGRDEARLIILIDLDFDANTGPGIRDFASQALAIGAAPVGGRDELGADLVWEIVLKDRIASSSMTATRNNTVLYKMEASGDHELLTDGAFTSGGAGDAGHPPMVWESKNSVIHGLFALGFGPNVVEARLDWRTALAFMSMHIAPPNTATIRVAVVSLSPRGFGDATNAIRLSVPLSDVPVEASTWGSVKSPYR